MTEICQGNDGRAGAGSLDLIFLEIFVGASAALLDQFEVAPLFLDVVAGFWTLADVVKLELFPVGQAFQIFLRRFLAGRGHFQNHARDDRRNNEQDRYRQPVELFNDCNRRSLPSSLGRVPPGNIGAASRPQESATLLKHNILRAKSRSRPESAPLIRLLRTVFDFQEDYNQPARL